LALRFGSHRRSIDLNFFSFHSKALMIQRLKSLTKFYGNMVFTTERTTFQLLGSCIVKSTMLWFCLLYFKTSRQIRKMNSTKSRFTSQKKLLMKRVYELDVYNLAEELSGMVGILQLTGKSSIRSFGISNHALRGMR